MVTGRNFNKENNFGQLNSRESINQTALLSFPSFNENFGDSYDKS